MFAKPQPKFDPELMRSCRYFLNDHARLTPAEALSEIAQHCSQEGVDWDRYGQGEYLNAFEREVAQLLGKPAALFVPSGVMAQLIALRIWTDRAGVAKVGFHATSHLEVNEEHAYQHLHGLEATMLGEPARPFRADEIPEGLAAVVLELPYRRLGGVLPTWEELCELARSARARGSRLHMDGARLWESQPFYGRPYAEICSLFDSVYVSFYKSLGGMTGAMLLGEPEFIDEARVWLRRHGGNLFHLIPYVVSTRMGLHRRLPLMPRYCERARALARALQPRVEIRGGDPQTSMMHLVLPWPEDKLYDWRDRVAREQGLWLGGFFGPGPREGASILEVAVGDETLRVTDDQVVRAFGMLG